MVAADAFGHVRLGGIGVWVEPLIAARSGVEMRVTIFGPRERGA